MTKTYEEAIRGPLGDLARWAKENEVRGEITMVLAGAPENFAEITTSQMVSRVLQYESAGMDRKSAISTVSDELSLPKRIVFAAMVDAKSASRISP